MDTLGKVIYVADITAPDRRYPALRTIRYHSLRNIDRAFQLALKSKMGYVLAKEQWLHPCVVAAWNESVRGPARPRRGTRTTGAR